MKRLLFFIFVFLFVVDFSFAHELLTARMEYSSFETLQFTLDLSQAPLEKIQSSNFRLYSSGKEIPIAFYVVRVSDQQYYGYALLPSLRNDIYSLTTKNLRFLNDEEIREEILSVNFSIVSRAESLSIFPAAISQEIKSYELPQFSFTVKNRGNVPLDLSFSTDASFLNRSLNTLRLSPQQQREGLIRIRESPLGTLEGNFIISYGNFSYAVPIHLVKTDIPANANSNTSAQRNTSELLHLEGKIEFSIPEEEIILNLSSNESKKGEITFRNSGPIDLHEVVFSFTGDMEEISRIKSSRMDVLRSQQDSIVEVIINPDKFLDKNYNGELLISSKEGAQARLPFYVYLKEEKIRNVVSNVSSNASSLYIPPNDSPRSPYLAWFIVLGLVVFVFIVIFFLYRRSRIKEQAFDQFIDDVKKKQQ